MCYAHWVWVIGGGLNVLLNWLCCRGRRMFKKMVVVYAIFMFEVFVEQGRLMLTGVILTFVASFLYQITPQGFKFLGRYRTKEAALVIYFAAAVVLGLMTPLFVWVSEFIIEYVPVLSIIGFLVISGNFILNQSVPSWSHTTPKTLVIYMVGFALLMLGVMIDI